MHQNVTASDYLFVSVLSNVKFRNYLSLQVVIPLEKIRCVNQSQHMKKPSQKYMEIVTVDNFDFWFMGFLNYQKAFKYLKEAMAISQA